MDSTPIVKTDLNSFFGEYLYDHIVRLIIFYASCLNLSIGSTSPASSSA